MKKLTLPFLTSYGRKWAFTNILTSLLHTCEYAIDAVFVWEKSDRIMTVVPRQADRLQLKINLNIMPDMLFSRAGNSADLAILYRAYFIESYIRQLEQVQKRLPEDYFTGLVLVEAAEGLCGSRKLVGHMVCPGRDEAVTAMDVTCTIQAMTRILLAERLRPQEKADWMAWRDALMDFCTVPEIAGNRRNKRCFSATVTLHALQRLAGKSKTNFAFLRLLAQRDWEADPFSALEQSCRQAENPFLLGLYIRLIASIAGKPDEDLRSREIFRIQVARYKEAVTAFFLRYTQSDDPLLHDNIAAIKMLMRGMQKAFPGINAQETGALHNY